MFTVAWPNTVCKVIKSPPASINLVANVSKIVQSGVTPLLHYKTLGLFLYSVVFSPRCFVLSQLERSFAWQLCFTKRVNQIISQKELRCDVQFSLLLPTSLRHRS